jgi:Conserved TM helix
MKYPTGIDLNQGLEDAWSKVATFVPKLGACLVVLVIGSIVARVLARIATKVVKRFGVDTIVAKAGLGKALGTLTASSMIGRIVRIVVTLVTLQTAFGVFGPNAVSDSLDGIVKTLPRIVVAGAIIVITGLIVRFVGDLLGDLTARQSWGPMARRAAAGAIWAVGGFAALSQMEVAPAIVNGLFYAVLAVIVGSAIIAIGGGGIQPMRRRWDTTLDKLDAAQANTGRALGSSASSTTTTDDSAAREAAEAARSLTRV